jgi:integrase
MRQGLIEFNPAAGVRLPKPHQTRPVVWIPTREQAWRTTGERPAVAVWSRQHLAAFLGYVRNDAHFVLWWLVSLTGLRRGELAALRWRDIDLDAGTLTVHEQIVVVDGVDVVGFPKSASSRRTIALDKITVELLCWLWRRHQDSLGATGHNPEGYVFVDATGLRLRPDFLTRRQWVETSNADCGLRDRSVEPDQRLPPEKRHSP